MRAKVPLRQMHKSGTIVGPASTNRGFSHAVWPGSVILSHPGRGRCRRFHRFRAEAARKRRRMLSIVIPVFNEEPIIERLHRELVDAVRNLDMPVLFLGGVQLMSIGILGEYIGRIYDEVKRRPLYLIQKVHQIESQRHESPRPIADRPLAA
jgi:hypothetical protein